MLDERSAFWLLTLSATIFVASIYAQRSTPFNARYWSTAFAVASGILWFAAAAWPTILAYLDRPDSERTPDIPTLLNAIAAAATGAAAVAGIGA